MNNFQFEDLNDSDFEDLVIRVCKEVLGVGCKTFSIGRDGAKDSWFAGTAEHFPSTQKPWSGTFCIQAKHTKTQNASCSDNDFSVNNTSILAKEIKRLKEEIKENPFQNYIIFTNRKLSGEKVSLIQQLKHEIGVKEADIIGREQLNTYLNDYPQIAAQFGLHKFFAPLRFFEKDLKEVIIVFAE
jgi:Txe/YoeB family toxin of Txe-Axe toxin-antitoxin module